jgi:hypothetical protein
LCVPALLADVRDLAREHTRAAIATLAGIMDDAGAAPAARASAATALLDRGWGRPAQFVETASAPPIKLTAESVKELTDDELRALIAAAGTPAALTLTLKGTGSY